MSQHRTLPFVFMNGAVSADGKLALENRSVIQFSSARDQQFVLQLRATADAILCGANTVETFSLDLGPGSEARRKQRQRRGLSSEPLRVLACEDGDIDPQAEIFRKCTSRVIVLTTEKAFKKCAARLHGLATVKHFGRKELNFRRAIHWLRREFKVKRLLCEGGGETNAALIQAGVVDELHVTICPLVLCGLRAPTFCDGEGVKSVRGAIRLKLKTMKVIRGELFLTYTVLGNPRRK